MKKTARVIVTLKCNRNCPGCCNMNLPEYREVHTDEELLDYEEIVITGGEPMLIPGKVLELSIECGTKGIEERCTYIPLIGTARGSARKF